jgi:type VI secretion system protein ImpB
VTISHPRIVRNEGQEKNEDRVLGDFAQGGALTRVILGWKLIGVGAVERPPIPPHAHIEGGRAVPDNTQHALDKHRTPRVHITYDVHRDGASISREIPFVVGVFADLSGHRDPAKPLPELQKRPFVEINGKTFDGIMADAAPRLEIQVENRVEENGKPLNLKLHFNKLDDFSPDRVARQVTELRELMDEREKLAKVMNQIESKPRFTKSLQDILDNMASDGPPSPEGERPATRTEE